MELLYLRIVIIQIMCDSLCEAVAVECRGIEACKFTPGGPKFSTQILPVHGLFFKPRQVLIQFSKNY
jgi:hypothetical protein